MIRKLSSGGVGYSVADLNHVRYIFVSAVPRAGADLFEQAHDALATIARVTDDAGPRGAIVQQAVFIRDHEEIPACKKIIEDFYCDALPATSYVVQPPCAGKELAIEAWGVGRRNGDFEIERVSPHLVILRHSDIAWAHCAGVLPDTPAVDVHTRSLNAFARMRELLASKGFGFEQVVRTWLYLGDIVGPEGDTQRYKELNRARTDFYRNLRFFEKHTPPGLNGAAYPASTGIGAGDRDVMMGSIAMTTERDDVVLVPLENPLQTPAFHYEQHHSPQSPKFARAMAVVGGRAVAIFVSGTASIVESETRFVGDVEGQTHQTLDNIDALIAPANFERHGVTGAGAALSDLVLLRVYIKRQEDYERTRAVCEERLGELPTIYAVADVCRPELLVEIEGVAFAPKG